VTGDELSLESALIDEAGGDFGLTIIAVLIAFLLSLCGILVYWIIKTVPEQMKQDREAICLKLGEMISALNETQATFNKLFFQHDQQAKEILVTDQRIETTLNNRPCVSSKR
jgi:hypothetical protein